MTRPRPCGGDGAAACLAESGDPEGRSRGDNSRHGKEGRGLGIDRLVRSLAVGKPFLEVHKRAVSEFSRSKRKLLPVHPDQKSAQG